MKRDDRQPSLDDRLRNWGRSNRGAYDPVDAERITRAWRTLSPKHRELLRMIYLWHAGREVVCRRLKIARHPRNLLDLELYAARCALVRALDADKINLTVRRVSFSP
ncbi:MAG: hypothetical protein EPN65_07620 [Pandoraea sp.]|uniref:Uncharacterized protein n=1 Tax=Trinickia dabaoshanensis TaxID=564714 RepID=A0A2N7VI34_9BURK|nr:MULTISPECIES: hypothetical protein [Burkholderiaceae]PMS16801.1 hypothetical protein C0Z18_21880 [Trinickia dabaoshanensis]TAM18599.1 MAG: hypothetical protein EPN65_07620 [Pandoraea sp.]TAM55341.1 MAG: hypothetical protein EPN57_02990 [Paraburkholderia sp.]